MHAHFSTGSGFLSAALIRQAGNNLIHEQQPNGPLFMLYDGWAVRYKTLRD